MLTKPLLHGPREARTPANGSGPTGAGQESLPVGGAVDTRPRAPHFVGMTTRQPVALTIAGSDSGGGAGIQADLKTFAALGVFGTTAITCLTAQNPREVAGVHPAPPEFVAEQIRAVLRGFRVRAAKTGMLFSAEIIAAAADALARAEDPFPLVVDPVMVATSGARLLREDAVEALRERLLPLATVVTPNLPEAEILLGEPIPDVDSARRAAGELAARLGAACLVKGGHLEEGEEVVDLLGWKGDVLEFRSPRIRGVSTHGSGCTLSAAIAAGLAKGRDVPGAVETAHGWLARALANPLLAWDEPSIRHLGASDD